MFCLSAFVLIILKIEKFISFEIFFTEYALCTKLLLVKFPPQILVRNPLEHWSPLQICIQISLDSLSQTLVTFEISSKLYNFLSLKIYRYISRKFIDFKSWELWFFYASMCLNYKIRVNFLLCYLPPRNLSHIYIQ